MDKPLQLTLRMNIYEQKSGQIDVIVQVERAIEHAFSLMDKTLNLEAFSLRPELKYIEVLFTNAATLAKILLQSARRYMGNIERVKLGTNSLRNCNGMRPMTWMKRLNSLDLSNNLVSI